MSGSGKSHWSRLVASAAHMQCIEFDDMIGGSQELAELIEGYEGAELSAKMGNYFGMPWDEGYRGKEDKFLEIEKRLMGQQFSGPVVLDLTGSCIYHPTELKALKEGGTTIYLETDKNSVSSMLETFLKHPKPVCWQGVFTKNDTETNDKALARCYPTLLETRASLYREAADLTIPFEIHRALKGADEMFHYLNWSS